VAPVELAPNALDLARWIKPGDGVLWGQACAEPVPLVDAFLTGDSAAAAAFVGLSWRDLPVPEDLRVVSYGALGRLGRLPGLEIVPCHFSALPRLFAAGALPGDVALIQVAPPDAAGRCSLGVSVDYLADALPFARVVIAEVNDRCPRTAGAWVAWDRLDAVMRTSRPLLEARAVAPSETDERIAEHVAALIEDGDTIQLGVGALPEAILGRLDGHRDLGLHSGMISDAVLRLIDAGVVTNTRKPSDRGLSVTGAALGSERLFQALDGREDIVFKAVSYTHAPAVLAGVGPLAAINSAVEIDLDGQVNSEEAAGRRIGAVGGQVDFLRAAALGGKPILALPAKRIVRQLSGPVGAARSDVDWVVTEHGARSLARMAARSRTRALLELAGGALG
jgi:acyl-CoA hydrolase